MRPEVVSPPPDRFRDLARVIVLILVVVAVGVGVVAGAALAFDYVARPAQRSGQSVAPVAPVALVVPVMGVVDCSARGVGLTADATSAPASSDSAGIIRFRARWAAPPICVFNVSASQIDYFCASER